MLLVTIHSVEQFNGVEEAESLEKFVIGAEADGWILVGSKTERGTQTNFDYADTNRDDMAFLSYTSGTTGNPKGVVHTHGWAFAHLRTAASQVGLELKKGTMFGQLQALAGKSGFGVHFYRF